MTPADRAALRELVAKSELQELSWFVETSRGEACLVSTVAALPKLLDDCDRLERSLTIASERLRAVVIERDEARELAERLVRNVDHSAMINWDAEDDNDVAKKETP